MLLHAVLVSLVLAPLLAVPPLGDTPKVDPREAKPATVCEWQAADGLKYEYFVPASYDPDKGANLTLVLHGNGLDQRWTFANHPAGEFRPADIVVSPDGTTPVAGTHANEFLGANEDVKRFHALLAELKKIWNVRQVFLYGHSQGSFFVFYYAGAQPDDVDGVCGQSSGVWNWTTTGSKGRHQAIGLMHGTKDQNVPYGQSWWGREHYVEAKYPLVHLRTLFDWDHRPNWRQAQLELAWCEGMTTTDPARMEACMTTLGEPDVPLGVDWSALWSVADRLAQEKSATDAQRKRAESIAGKVNDLAGRHVVAIEAAAGKGGVSELKKLADTAAVGHLIRFLEEFEAVPARCEWVSKNQGVFRGLAESGKDNAADYWRNADKSPAKAFKAGLALVETGYTHFDVPKVIAQLERWAADKNVQLSDGDKKRLATLAEAYRSGRAAGFADFEKLDAELRPLE